MPVMKSSGITTAPPPRRPALDRARCQAARPRRSGTSVPSRVGTMLRGRRQHNSGRRGTRRIARASLFSSAAVTNRSWQLVAGFTSYPGFAHRPTWTRSADRDRQYPVRSTTESQCLHVGSFQGNRPEATDIVADIGPTAQRRRNDCGIRGRAAPADRQPRHRHRGDCRRGRSRTHRSGAAATARHPCIGVAGVL